MKRLKKIKELAIAAWQALNDKEIANHEKKNDVASFIKFLDKLLIAIYVIFGIFSFIGVYFFITRAIL